MKKFLIVIFGASLLLSCGSKDYPRKYHQRNNEYHQRNNKYHHTETDCSNLSQDEKTFAKKLSSLHKEIFCKMFTDEQRNDAMEICKKDKQMGSRGKSVYHIPVSADAAVEKVLRNSREEKSNRDTARAYYNLY